MAFSRNLCDKPRIFFVGYEQYASAKLLVFLDLAGKFTFLNWKYFFVPLCKDGWTLFNVLRYMLNPKKT